VLGVAANSRRVREGEKVTDHTSIIIDWRGAFYLEEIYENPDWKNGVYLFFGKEKNKHVNKVQYCGITEGSFATRFSQHHKLPKINRDLRIWLGSVVYPQDASRYYLEIAEAIIIYFWQPALNDRKRVIPPKPVTLLSRWFKTDGSARLIQHSMCKEIDDVLSWDGKLWRTGNLSVWED
jgi:hypothetical protein